MPGSEFPLERQGYDYIIAGAGCAGLSLVAHMIISGKFEDKKILIVDKEEKKENDRSWCFWETKPGPFEKIVLKKWEKLWFYEEEFSSLLEIQPYQYKLIRSIDFYRYSFDLISRQKNITVLTGNIEDIICSTGETCIVVNGKKFYATYIFNSILLSKPLLKKKDYWLWQHFKGWMIETEKPVFNSSEAILMDFRVEQKYGTAFGYCLPFASNIALAEYTLITKDFLTDEQYDIELKKYIGGLTDGGSFSITEKEYGVIPMTTYRFPLYHGNVINIGTAGGQTRASSGYTFRFIQKHSAKIVKQLIETGRPFIPASGRRFRFYDRILLNLLYNNSLPAKRIFSDFFRNNKPQRVLRFLDNESSVWDEVGIVSSLPAWPFLKAAIKQL